VALGRGAMLGYGAAGLVLLIGAVLFIRATDPSEQDARAFVQKLLLAGEVNARGADGAVITLAGTEVARVAEASCRPDLDAAGHGRRWSPVNRSFLCRYAVVASDDAPFEVMLRAVREPRGGPADAPGLSPLVDPERYRVGSFRLVPIGRSEAESLLGTPVP
jgi:hypothetical protein